MINSDEFSLRIVLFGVVHMIWSWTLTVLTGLVGAVPYESESVPDALSFVEPLAYGLHPSEIVIYSGGFSAPGTQREYSELSAKTLRQLASHHGYQLVFLNELEYDRSLMHGPVKYAPNWHKIFALPSLRSAFPRAKFYVWFDDDILAPYKETHMLNHYLNIMYRNTAIQFMVADEGAPYMLNTGIMLMANTEQTMQIARWMLEVGQENNGYLAQKFYHEQDAMVVVRAKYNFRTTISVIGHRNGYHNINTFARWDAPQDAEETRARRGDAFVHFLGYEHGKRLRLMREWLEQVAKVYPQRATLPIARDQWVSYA